MKAYKTIIFTFLTAYTCSVYTNHQPLNLDHTIPDAEFDAIVTKPWSKLSFADKEKINHYLLCKMQDPQLEKTMKILAKMNVYKDYIKNMRQDITAAPLDATDRHIIRYHDEIQYFINTHQLPNITNAVYQKAKKLEKEGYAVFFHGQQWHFRFLQRIYKDLYKAYYGVSVPNDFTFIHFKKANRNYNPQAEKNKRLEILSSKNGWTYSRDTLFMNKPLFGNVTFTPSCSLYYFANNYNEYITDRIPTLKDVFSYFGASKLYNHYESDLYELEELHKNASKYGNLLLVAIPKNILNDCVFKTRHWNKDSREYCLIMTHDIALNPDSGMKVHAFNVPKNTEYKKFKEEYDTVMKRITRRIKRQTA